MMLVIALALLREACDEFLCKDLLSPVEKIALVSAPPPPSNPFFMKKYVDG